MLDKDEVMPLSTLLGGAIHPLFAAGWAAGIKAQRDADFEVLERGYVPREQYEAM